MLMVLESEIEAISRSMRRRISDSENSNPPIIGGRFEIVAGIVVFAAGDGAFGEGRGFIDRLLVRGLRAGDAGSIGRPTTGSLKEQLSSQPIK
jgi:hypothetical protein